MVSLEGSDDLDPQTNVEVPQTAEFPWAVDVPQTAELPHTALVPQTAEAPSTKTAVPHTALVPQTADVPQIAAVPHTVVSVLTTRTVFVEASNTALGDAAV